MRIDLHAHSAVSDGTTTPTELVDAAAAAGLDVLALTDHDTTRGWDEARLAATGSGVALVPGIEISTAHQGRGVHLLAYLLDPTHPSLVAQLDRIVAGRRERVPTMLAGLRAAGVGIEESDLDREGARTASTGRPHVADALVRLGVVADRDEAFRDWLDVGRPGYVDRYAPALAEMIGVVEQSGGVSVVAHPWGRRGEEVLTAGVLAELASLGLTGIEVDHRDHDDEARRRLAALAEDLDLVATGSSDHHGAGKVDHDLGCHTTDPAQYERLLDRARAAAQRSARPVPTVTH